MVKNLTTVGICAFLALTGYIYIQNIQINTKKEINKEVNNVFRLSNSQVEKMLIEDVYKIDEPLYYGLYQDDQKIGYAKYYGFIDTISSNEIYLTTIVYSNLNRTVGDNIDSLIQTSLTTYNALPPYELIKEEEKTIQYGLVEKVITKIDKNKYIINTYRGEDKVHSDTTDCAISNYGLRDLFVFDYCLSELNQGNSSFFPNKYYSSSLGKETIDSISILKEQNYFFAGNNIKSHTIGYSSEGLDMKIICDEYGYAISWDFGGGYETRLEDESLAKDIDYSADLLSVGNAEMIPTKADKKYDDKKEISAVIYEIHGEYDDSFVEDNHQVLFNEFGKKYIKSYNLNSSTSSNKSEIDSLLTYSDAKHPINDIEIINFAKSAINLNQEDSLKVNELLNFVYDYVEYSWVQKWHNNVYSIIDSKKGVCADKAYLFSVLARSLGIPCKEITGLAYSENEWGMHAWNEVYINNNWYSLDPTGGMWKLPIDIENNILNYLPHLKMNDDYMGNPQFSLSISSIILDDGSKVDFVIDENPSFDFCFSGDCVNGIGTFTYANGDKYEGEWKDDLRQGFGIYTWADGNKYEGEFKDERMNGNGAFTWADGNKYVGEWKDDYMHGAGTFTYANGDKYVGEWKDDYMHGNGTYTYASGEKYVGEYKDDLMHGTGTFTYANGDKYVGEWKNDEKDGQGTYIWADGDRYRGEWRGNLRHGVGTFTWADGELSSQRQTWNNGERVFVSEGADVSEDTYYDDY